MSLDPTKTPWTTKGRAYKDSNFGGYGCAVTGPSEGDTIPTICKVYGGTKDQRDVAEANAAFIVRAVNSHAALVDILTRLVEANALSEGGLADYHHLWDQANVVLVNEALARKEPPCPSTNPSR